MTKDNNKSLGDQQTQQKDNARETSDKSLGDHLTFVDEKTPLVEDFEELDAQSVFDIEMTDLSKRYKIEGVLGKGGMGEVLLATDMRLERRVAIKRILGETSKSRTAVSRFLIEAKSIAALSHSNIVHINDFGHDKEGPFLIMEYVDGGSLLDRCREGAIPVDQAIELLCQICDGLGKAHELGIIHRDIKPANILLTKEGKPKLTDFGLAKAKFEDQGMTMTGAVLGTLDFMAPEQRKDVALTDGRSDLWSLAATLYQMVTGEPPRVIDLDAVSPELRSVLTKGLKRKKEERFQSAKEFRDALRSGLQGIKEIYLEEGICPNCGSKNPVDRKFCRNESCGGELQVSCFSCSNKIPAWEKICGKCGGKQRDLLEKRKIDMASQQVEAEDFLIENDFDSALKLAIRLRDEPDTRLAQFKVWSEKFLAKVEKAKEEQFERVNSLVSEALSHEQAYDYAAAVQTLEQVPRVLSFQALGSLGGKSANQFLEVVKRKYDALKHLEKSIRQRVAVGNLKGLMEEVEQFLILRPSHQGMLKFKEQLVNRQIKQGAKRDEIYKTAFHLMKLQDYEGVLREIARIDPDLLEPEIVQLRENAANALSQLKILGSLISKALEQKQYQGLIEQVNEFLKIKSDDKEMNSLKTKLKVHEEKTNNVISRTTSLMRKCNFLLAEKELLKFPSEFYTEEIYELLAVTQKMLFLRRLAIAALTNGIEKKNYRIAFSSVVSDYKKAFLSREWEDANFNAHLEVCQQGLLGNKTAKMEGLLNKQKGNRSIKGLKYYKKNLIIAFLSLFLIFLILISFLLWSYQSIRGFLVGPILIVIFYLIYNFKDGQKPRQ